MEEKKYYTVAEYAEMQGISKQAVYQALNKKLKGYSTKVDGKTMLVASALSAKVGEATVNENSTGKLFNNQSIVQEIESLKKQIEDANDKVNLLNKQIETLGLQLTTKDEQISKLQQALDQQQRLQLMTQQKQLNRGFFARLFAGKETRTE